MEGLVGRITRSAIRAASAAACSMRAGVSTITSLNPACSAFASACCSRAGWASIIAGVSAVRRSPHLQADAWGSRSTIRSRDPVLLGCHGERKRQCGLTGAALLGNERYYLHVDTTTCWKVGTSICRRVRLPTCRTIGSSTCCRRDTWSCQRVDDPICGSVGSPIGCSARLSMHR